MNTPHNEQTEARLEKLILVAAASCVVAMIYLVVSAVV